MTLAAHGNHRGNSKRDRHTDPTPDQWSQDLSGRARVSVDFPGASHLQPGLGTTGLDCDSDSED